MPIKTYQVIYTKTKKDGSTYSYVVTKKYEVKHEKPPLTQEQVEELKQQHGLGVPKTVLCSRFNISYHILNKYLHV